jgi:hypothetical protein
MYRHLSFTYGTKLHALGVSSLFCTTKRETRLIKLEEMDWTKSLTNGMLYTWKHAATLYS